MGAPISPASLDRLLSLLAALRPTGRARPAEALRLARAWRHIDELAPERQARAVGALLGASSDEIEAVTRLTLAWARPVAPPPWTPSRLWWPLLLGGALALGWKTQQDLADPDGDGRTAAQGDCAPRLPGGWAWLVDADADGVPADDQIICADAAPSPLHRRIEVGSGPIQRDLCDDDAYLGSVAVLVGVDEDGDGYAAPVEGSDGAYRTLSACDRAPDELNLDGEPGCGGGADCMDDRADVYPGAPDDDADGVDQDCDCADGPLPSTCPPRILPDEKAPSRLLLGIAASVALLGLLVAMAVPWGRRIFARQRVAASRDAIEALSGPRALALTLPPLVSPIPVGLVRLAARELLGEGAELGRRLDVARTVSETARQGGAPRLIWQPTLAGQNLDLWVEQDARLAGWSGRVSALVADLKLLGFRVKLERFEADGTFVEPTQNAPGRPLIVIGLGRGLDQDAPVVLGWRERRRRAWLHPSADSRIHPADFEPIFPFDGEGLRGAFAAIRGARADGVARESRIGELDRLRLIWLHGVADLLSPDQSARLLRSLAPRTPEAVGLLAADWVGERAASDWPARWQEADAILRAAGDGLVRDEARVYAAIAQALAVSEPAAGGFAHVLWRRERAWLALRRGQVEEALSGMAALRDEGLAALLPLGRDRLTPALRPHERSRLDGLRRSWALARGAPVAARSATPIALVGLLAGGKIAWDALHRQVEQPERQILRLEVQPDGTARVSAPSPEVVTSAFVYRRAPAGVVSSEPITLGPGGAPAPIERLSGGECVQVQGKDQRGENVISNVAGVSGAVQYGTVMVRPGKIPDGVEGLELWLGCDGRWTTKRLPLPDEFTSFVTPTCDYRVIWVAWGDSVRWKEQEGGVSVAAEQEMVLELPPPLWTDGGAIAVPEAPQWLRLSVTDTTGEPYRGLGTLVNWDTDLRLPALGSSLFPAPSGIYRFVTNKYELCSQILRVGGGSRAAPQMLKATLGPCDARRWKTASFTVALPDGVGLDEVFVNPKNGGRALGVVDDHLEVSAARSLDQPYDYNLELGGSTRYFTAKPKNGVYYDETDWFAVTPGESYAADLRGEPKIGVLQLCAADPRLKLGEVLDLESASSQNGSLDLVGARAAGRAQCTWLAAREGGLVIRKRDGTTMTLLVKAGVTNKVSVEGGVWEIPGPVLPDIDIINAGIKLEPVHFDYDSSAIRKQDMPYLNQIAQVLRDYPGIVLEVAGHTDESGTTEYNLQLGQRYADAVKRYLIGQKVSPEQLKTISYSEERPVAFGGTADANALNRRVEFRIVTLDANAPAPAGR